MCPVSDVIGAIVEAFADAAPEIEAGVGAAGAAGVADAAGAFGGGAADAIDTSALTSGAIGDTATAANALGSATAGLDASLPSELSSLGASLPADAGGVAGTSASLGTDTMLPEQTVIGTAPGATGGSALGDLAGGVGSTLGLAGLAGGIGASAGGGGSGVPGTAGQPADFSGNSGPLSASNTPQFLSADTTGPSLQSLTEGQAQDFGIDTSGGDLSPIPTNIGGFGGDINTDSLQEWISDPTQSGAGSFGQGIENWVTNPKNLGTEGLLGLSLKSALSKPKLPGASAAADASAEQAIKSASSVIQSGGTATPEWATQKASIDATIDEQIRQQSEAIQQAAASSGEGNQNSGIVQQQIAQMTQNANVQRQQLYAQAQQQNVQNALSELSGGDQVLTSIGNMQLQQSEEAQNLAAQTAEMALLLQSGGSMKIPGLSVGGT